MSTMPTRKRMMLARIAGPEKLSPILFMYLSKTISMPSSPESVMIPIPTYPARRSGRRECAIKLSAASFTSFQKLYDASPWRRSGAVKYM